MPRVAETNSLRNALLATAILAALSAAVGGVGSASTSPATGAAAKGKRYPVRGIYDGETGRQAALGFNFIDTGPGRDQVRAIAARGLKPFVWLGGYSNTACQFNETDEWVRSHVRAIAGLRRRAGGKGRRHRRQPVVGAYFIDDEPDARACPTAPGQMRARSALVKSIDSRPPTFIVTNQPEQLELYAGTVDVIGLDHYPCSITHGCAYSKIDRQAAKADRLGVRYWGVIQAHGDDWYKVPTRLELHRQFVHWRNTNMEGYLVFAWRFPADDPSRWLANNPALKAQLAVENRVRRPRN
jgi:hypothetical protein